MAVAGVILVGFLIIYFNAPKSTKSTTKILLFSWF